MAYINSMGTNEIYTGTYRNKTEQRGSGSFEIPEHKQLQQYVPLLVTVDEFLIVVPYAFHESNNKV